MVCVVAGLSLALASCGKEKDITVKVRFEPVITAIGAQRSGSSVTFTAEVSDAGPLSALTYSWGFDGGLAFVDNTVNPAVLQGYDETISGNLKLTVTNGKGAATTVSYYIAPGLFSDNVVVSLPRSEGSIRGNDRYPHHRVELMDSSRYAGACIARKGGPQ
jgi:hypothetical protein